MKRLPLFLALLWAPIALASFVILSPGVELPGEDEGYTLDSIGDVPFAYSIPIAPTTSGEPIEITNTSEYTANRATNGRVFHVAAGTYSATFDCETDQHWILDADAIFSGASIGGTRCIVEGGQFGGDFDLDQPTDLLLDGITHDGDYNEWWGATRVAIINSTISTERFAIYWLGGFADAIIANCDIQGGTHPTLHQATHRSNQFAGTQNRIIVVDSRFQASNRHAFRLHDTVSNAFISRNRFQDNGSWIDPEDGNANAHTITDVWFNDNVMQGGVVAFQFGAAGSRLIGLRASGNRLHSDSYTPGTSVISSGSTWTVSDNLAASFASAPTWTQQ